MIQTWRLVYVSPSGRELEVGSWTGSNAQEALTKALPMFDIEFKHGEARFSHKAAAEPKG